MDGKKSIIRNIRQSLHIFINTKSSIMDLTLKKNQIKKEIDKIEDEKLVWAIARLLHLDDEGDIPEWHWGVVKERAAKYAKGKSKMKDWDGVRKQL